MNTNTANPEAPDTDTDTSSAFGTDSGPRTDSGYRTGAPFSFGSDRPALRRPFEDRVLGGVAAGIARYLGVDPTIIRIAFVVLTLVGGGGIALYLAGLLLIPDEGSDQSIARSVIESFRSR
jgi:phage shock protein PspC (stress-responsive transcriptional regulator)